MCGIKKKHRMRQFITIMLVCLIIILTQIEITGYIFQFFDIVAGEPPKSWVLEPFIGFLSKTVDNVETEEVLIE